jgi:putative redox protein
MSQESVKQALSDLIGSVSSNPAAGKVVFRASTSLEDDVRCSARVRQFPVMSIDEPPELGGADAGPNPLELVLVALGTCQEIMFAAYAAFMGIKLDECKVELKGYVNLSGLLSVDPEVKPGYQKIVYETRIKSSADDAALLKLIEVVESHCPVMDVLLRPQHITGKAIVNGRELHTFSSEEVAETC